MPNQNRQLRLDLREEGLWEKLPEIARADCIAALMPLVEEIWVATGKEQDDERQNPAISP
jgi:hypothetical protein